MKPRPLGKLVLFLLIIAGALTIGLRGMVRSWELQRRLACAEQMKRIGAALGRCASDVAASDADALDWLAEHGALQAADLRCPAARHANYVLTVDVAHLAAAATDGENVLLYEPMDNHGTGGNVLFADGHVSFVGGDDFGRLTGQEH